LALFGLLLTACSKSPPPIGSGLPKDFSAAATAFDERVRQRFPVGSEEEKLVAELRNQQFSIQEISDKGSRYKRSAGYEVGDLACKETWTILWVPLQGKVADIKGTYRQVCL
jgi:hypothetical protein